MPLPGLGVLTGLSGARDVAELYYGFTGFLAPTTIYEVQLGGASEERRLARPRRARRRRARSRSSG